MPMKTLTDVLNQFEAASVQLRDAIRACDRWLVEKPVEKMAAIARIMTGSNPLTGKGHSASSAEAIVETDPEYAAFLAQGTANTLARLEAETRYRAAQFRCEAASRGLAA
jgi:hypothetical protein